LITDHVNGIRYESAKWLVDRDLDYVWLNARQYNSIVDGGVLKTAATLRPEYRVAIQKLAKTLIVEPMYILQ
jgi:hypothetical protein